jgi:pyrrolidone-carboxylate peptidase
VKILQGKVVADHEIVTACLSVVRQECVEVLIRQIKKVNPVLILAIGQAGGAK